jgi:hypothetical protein
VNDLRTDDALLREMGAVEYPQICRLLRERNLAEQEYRGFQERGELWAPSYRRFCELVVQLENAQKAARDAWATRLGWRYSAKTFNLNQLRAGRSRRCIQDFSECTPYRDPIEHVEAFKMDGQPIGVVAHSRGPIKQLFEFAKTERPHVEVLPASWHLPGEMIAVVLTRLPAHKVVRLAAAGAA